jgi:hypothetical protein
MAIFNYLFFTGFVKLKKNEFRHELLASSNGKIQTIEMHKKDLFLDKNGVEWKDKNKEVFIQNCFYEVLRIVENGPFAIIYLIKDENESKLLASFLANQNAHSDFVYSLVKIYASLFCVEAIGNYFGTSINHYEKYIVRSDADHTAGYCLKEKRPPRSAA